MKHKNPARYSNRAAFSLVEIALVVAVLATAVIPLVALLPTGLKNFRGAMNQSVCAQIAQRVVNDAAQADFDTLVDWQKLRYAKASSAFTFRAPNIENPGLRYFDDQGSEIVPANEKGLSAKEAFRVAYQVNVRIQPQASVPASDSVALKNISPDLALITVQVVFEPPSVKLAFSRAAADDPAAPDRNLVTGVPATDLYTFSALIGRGR